MSTINEVYGSDFTQEAFAARVSHITDLISSNFANLNFKLRHDFSSVFRTGGMDPREINQIIARTNALNPDILVTHINKETEDIKMIPYFITIPVEYFRIIDLLRQKIYLVYVSTQNMEAY
jgi:hypothetical protein